jgi:RecJ-like exonuclease
MSDRMEPPEPECARCGNYLDDEDMDNEKCSKCGYDGTIEECDGCGKNLHPSNREGLCKDCQLEEAMAQFEEPYRYMMWDFDFEEGEEHG